MKLYALVILPFLLVSTPSQAEMLKTRFEQTVESLNAALKSDGMMSSGGVKTGPNGQMIVTSHLNYEFIYSGKDVPLSAQRKQNFDRALMQAACSNRNEFQKNITNGNQIFLVVKNSSNTPLHKIEYTPGSCR
jgi:hypothetical protein